VCHKHVCEFIDCSSLVSDCKYIRRASSHRFSRISDTSIRDSIATPNRLTTPRSSSSASIPSKAKHRATPLSQRWRSDNHDSNCFELGQQGYPSLYALAVFSVISPDPLQR
jgi:hypothetical protein